MRRKTILSKARFLLDVNALVALTEQDHVHHKVVTRWFNASGRHDWGVCPFTEAGYLRVLTRARADAHTIEDAVAMLVHLAAQPGYRYWPISTDWNTIAAPFQGRIFGPRQITDAWLLGLAVKENGVLVTLDRAISYLAGDDFSRHLLVLG
jgi:uncharacterized protein